MQHQSDLLEIASFFEAHREGVLGAVSQGFASPSQSKVLLNLWADAVLSHLRGSKGHFYEWTVSFVSNARESGLSSADAIGVIHEARNAFMRAFSTALGQQHLQGALEALLAVEDSLVRQICALSAEADQKALVTARRQLAALVDTIERPFIVLDSQAHVDLANQSFASLLSIPEEALLKRDFLQLCSDSSATELRRILRQKRPSTARRKFDGELLTPRGVAHPVSFSVVPIFDEKGLRSGAAVSITPLRAGFDPKCQFRAGFWTPCLLGWQWPMHKARFDTPMRRSRNLCIALRLALNSLRSPPCYVQYSMVRRSGSGDLPAKACSVPSRPAAQSRTV